MSDDLTNDEFIDELLDSGDSDTKLVKDLRAALKKAAKQNTDTAKALEDLKQEQSKQKLTAVWDELGVPEKTRGLYNGDPEPDKVKAWVEEYREVFNIPTKSTDGGAEGAGEEHPLAQLQKLGNLGNDQEANLGQDAARKSGRELVQNTRPSRNPNALTEWLANEGFPSGVDSSIQ